MKIARVTGIILLVFCVGMLAGAAFSYTRTRAFIGSADRAQGTAVEMVEGLSSEGDVVYGAVVRFADAAGEEHVARSSVFQSPAPFEVGDTVEILYRPTDPDDARIGTFAELWFVPAMFGGSAAVALAAGLFFLFALPRFARRRAQDKAPPKARRSRMWFGVRMAALALAFAAGALNMANSGAGADDVPSGWMLGVEMALIAVFLPVMLAGLIGVAALFSGRARTWYRPTHSSPPFSMGNPLLFFHFCASVAIASGLGMAMTSFLRGFTRFPEGMLVLVGGISCHTGVLLAMRLCQHKIVEEVD